MLRKNEDWLDNKGQRRKGAGGVDGVTVEELEEYMKANWNSIKEQIRERKYKPQTYIWLLNGEKAPRYRAICRFRSNVLSECAEEIFYELDRKLKDKGEICYGGLLCFSIRITGKITFCAEVLR